MKLLAEQGAGVREVQVDYIALPGHDDCIAYYYYWSKMLLKRFLKALLVNATFVF